SHGERRHDRHARLRAALGPQPRAAQRSVVRHERARARLGAVARRPVLASRRRAAPRPLAPDPGAPARPRPRRLYPLHRTGANTRTTPQRSGGRPPLDWTHSSPVPLVFPDEWLSEPPCEGCGSTCELHQPDCWTQSPEYLAWARGGHEPACDGDWYG